MPNQFSNNVEIGLKNLANGNNHYIYVCLRKFAKDQLAEIKTICKNLYFEEDAIEKAQLAYIAELAKLDYIKAYVSHTLKPAAKDSHDLCKQSLAKFIYSQNEALEDVESFTLGEINGLTNHTEELLSQIEFIRLTITAYNKPNKQDMVTEFKNELCALNKKVHAQPFPAVMEEVKRDLARQLEQLQKKEEAYYAGLRFFSQHRKSNSTLQPKIEAAKRILI